MHRPIPARPASRLFLNFDPLCGPKPQKPTPDCGLAEERAHLQALSDAETSEQTQEQP
jgi:hypothetical protein